MRSLSIFPFEIPTVEEEFPAEETGIPPEVIINAVCRRTRVDRGKIFSGDRKRKTSYARHLSMFLIFLLTKESKADLSRLFGRDHATVIAGIRRVCSEVRSYSDVRADIKNIAVQFVSTEELNILLKKL